VRRGVCRRRRWWRSLCFDASTEEPVLSSLVYSIGVLVCVCVYIEQVLKDKIRGGGSEERRGVERQDP
jgi:hypothetical protein